MTSKLEPVIWLRVLVTLAYMKGWTDVRTDVRTFMTSWFSIYRGKLALPQVHKCQVPWKVHSAVASRRRRAGKSLQVLFQHSLFVFNTFFCTKSYIGDLHWNV